MTDLATRPKPQTASEANPSMAAIVTIIVTASATRAGIRLCSTSCRGQTSAMMKSASVKGAKTMSA